MQLKHLHTQVPYREIRYNYALSDALSYITWGLVGDIKNKEEREPVKHLLESL